MPPVAISTAVRDGDTVSSHMPNTKIGSTPSSGQPREWPALGSTRPWMMTT